MSSSYDIANAEDMLLAMGHLIFWRELTPFEEEFGDIPRVSSDFDRVEIIAAERLTPIVTTIIDQLVNEAIQLVESGDMDGIAKLEATHRAALTKAIIESSSDAVDVGKQQVFDQFKSQLGMSMADSLPPRSRPKLTKEYLRAKAQTQAKAIADDIVNAIQRMAISQASRDMASTAELKLFAQTEAGRGVRKAAIEVAREGIAVGRYNALLDTKYYMKRMVYTAIMDDRTCGACKALDGQEVSDPSAAPNPYCSGELNGNTCRCIVVVEYAPVAQKPRGDINATP